jgi:hypothetical protein
MGRIRIPVEELAEVIEKLRAIRERIERTASLQSVGSEDDVGDSGLTHAVTGFDGAWKGGHERVQENVDTFRDTVDGIIKNFEDTDAQLVQELEKLKNEASGT